MNSILCAFSSDRREIYKADIYRVLALPAGHIIHFRYDQEYVASDIKNNSEKYKEEKVAIFFTSGNKVSGPKGGMKSHSIRWAKLMNTELSSETGVFHAYLKLEGFCDIDLMSEIDSSSIFFGHRSVNVNNVNASWKTRVELIHSHFQDMIFFNLKNIKKGKDEVKIKYTNNYKFCHYGLNHGQKYSLEMAVANPSHNTGKIEVSDSSEEIIINCINPLETTTRFDDFDIPFLIKSLQLYEQSSLLQFKPINSSGDNDKHFGEYTTNIELSLKLNLLRPAFFGLASTVAMWAFLLVRPVSIKAEWPEWPIIVFATLAFFISTAALFRWFDKK